MTVAERRLAKLEVALRPTLLVLRWLAEAHAYDDLTADTRALVEADATAFPLDRLAQEAQESARQRSRGLPSGDAEAAVRSAIVETVLRALLVLRINVLSQEVLEREVLVHAALGAYLGLAVDGPRDRLRHQGLLGLVGRRDVLLGRVTELHALETARAAVEARYLDGTAALFPAAVRAWAEQRTRSETMAVMALRLAELEGADPPPPDDPAALEARVAALVADLVQPARVQTFEQLGDGRRAFTLAVRWLRAKLLADDPAVRRS